MSDTPIYDQMREEAEVAEIAKADAHTIRTEFAVMSA